MKNLKNYFLVALLLGSLSSCNREEESLPQHLHADGKCEITITGEGMKSTRAENGRIQFTGGYATGAGLYDGGATAEVKAVAYDGYQLKKFEGGPIGQASIFKGKSNYEFGIDNQDWKFGVTFKKEYRINLTAGEGGTVSGGGVVLEGDDCTITATPNEGYTFAGWYDGNNMISDLANYTFTITGNRDLQARFIVMSSRFAFITWGLYEIGKIITPEFVQSTGMNRAGEIVYGNGRYIVGGCSGVNSETLITTSTNGRNWTTPVMLARVDVPNDICYSYGNNFVMACNNSKIFFSNNGGDSWIAHNVKEEFFIPDWVSVAYGNGRYVVVGGNRVLKFGYITTSIDGQNWTTPPRMENRLWYDVAYGNGKFVTVGAYGYIITSTDGINWSNSVQLGTNNWRSIAYGNGKFVVMGANGYVATSTDGINWSMENMPDTFGEIDFSTIAYNKGTFAIVGSSYYQNPVWKYYLSKSSDGKKWTSPTEMKDANGKNYLIGGICPIP